MVEEIYSMETRRGFECLVWALHRAKPGQATLKIEDALSLIFNDLSP